MFANLFGSWTGSQRKCSLKAVPYTSAVHYTRCCEVYLLYRCQKPGILLRPGLSDKRYWFMLFMKTVRLPACLVLTLLQIVYLAGPINSAAYGGSGYGSPEVSMQAPVARTGANTGIAQPSSFSTNNKKSNTATKPEPNMELAGFFFIGLIINLLVMAVYARWAYKQWKKRS